MAFLRNRAVNWLNLHSGIHALAQGMGGVFVLVFLLRAGISIAASLCAMALIVAARFVVRPLVPGVAARFGLRPVLIGGCLFAALQYPLLAEVTGPDWTLVRFCLVSALGEAFYWTAFHAYFTLLGDSEHRGHQISANIALSALVNIAGPLIGAWALVSTGARANFGIAGLVQALAAVPLLATPNVAVPAEAPRSLRSALPGVGLFMTDGWITAGLTLTWQIALFRSLGESVSAYGGAIALAAVVGAVSGLLLGRHIDAGNGRRAVPLAFTSGVLTLVLRALAVGTPWLAVLGNAVGAFAVCLQGPTQMVPVYNLAKVSPCALRFHVAAEGGWDIGCAVGCLTAALLVSRGVSLGAVIATAFLGLVVQALLQRRYYLRLSLW